MAIQKALLVPKKFADFVVGDTEKYKPGPGEILIKVQSAALNPADWKIRKFGVIVEEYPAVLGIDIAGDVEELGEGVTDFKKGDRVFCASQWDKNKSAFQQYTLALASTTARIPTHLSYDDAATIPVGLSTAWVGLYNKNPYGAGFSAPISPAEEGKYAGEPIVILGGASSVGQAVIQLAKLSGFSPIITSASLKHTEYLQSLGATHILDRNLSVDGLKLHIDKAMNGKAVKIVYDAVAVEDTQRAGLSLLASGGQMIITTNPVVKGEEGKSIHRVLASLRIPPNIETLEALYQHKVTGFLERGVFKVNNCPLKVEGI
ncbi:hypothetical protein NLJ89_g1035 [Agrocybe chaxingu]|uniref:Enoyl reductase (ER) domain-containing protein n=1 Tax=Agrocybe chaxingu TaxID=84603 RepID=A0A9W8N0R4_9AGAR|nr:hypothetical protein NLJ89_g1035 [Agrocybe chaxingu]